MKIVTVGLFALLALPPVYLRAATGDTGAVAGGGPAPVGMAHSPSAISGAPVPTDSPTAEPPASSVSAAAALDPPAVSAGPSSTSTAAPTALAQANHASASDAEATAGPSGDAGRPCGADGAKYCAGQVWGHGLGKCLKAHEAQLSPSCKAGIRQAKEKFSEFKGACGSDVRQFCNDVKKGQGQVFGCLQSHAEQISQSCKGEIGNHSG